MLVFLPDKKTGRGRWFVVDSKCLMSGYVSDNIELYGEQISLEDIFDDEYF